MNTLNSNQVKTNEIANFVLVTEAQKLEIIKAHESAKKEKRLLAKANRTFNDKNRISLNSDVRAELMNFDDVFKTVVRKKFDFLTSRPTIAKVTENLSLCESVLSELCSNKVLADYNSDKNITISWERLPRIITDKKLLFAFTTKAQQKEGKVWTASAVIDLVMKGLTCKVQNYELAIKNR